MRDDSLIPGVKSISFLGIALVFAPAQAAPKFDSSALTAGKTAVGSPTKATPAHATSKKAIVDSSLKGGEISEEESKELVESMSLLLKNPPAGSQEVRLRLGRAQALMTLARASLLRSKSSKLSASDENRLAMARSDVAKALKNPSLSAPDRAQAWYLAGLSYVYSDSPAKALPYLEKAYSSYPKGHDAREWIGIYLAEELFERGDFARSIPYYAEASAPRSPYRNLARYKTAWCLLNLKRVPEAERVFTELAKDPASEAFGRDSLKDLAFISARFRNDTEALELVKRLGLQGDARTEFLRRVQDQREAQNDMDPSAPVFRSLLAAEKDPARRIKLWLSVVRGTYRQYADSRHFDALEHVYEEVRKAGWKPGTPTFNELADPIDQETQRLLRSFVETYADRTRTPDAKYARKDALAVPLGRAFQYYEHYFPASPRLPAILELHADVCQSEKDWPCVKETSRRLLALPDSAQGPRASAEIRGIEACDRLKAYEKSGTDEFCRGILESFVTSQEKAPEWPVAAAKLAELRVSEGKAGEANALFESLWKRDPKPAVFQRIQRLRFDAGQLDELIADPRNSKQATEPGLREILREAHLKKALLGKAASSEDDYRKHLEGFLALSPDPAKAAVARADLIRFLLDKGASGAAVAELLKIKTAERLRPPFRPLMLEAAYERLKEGDAAGASALWKGERMGGKDLPLLQAYVDVASGRWPSSISLLTAADREHILGLLALSRPRATVTALSSLKKLNARERALLLFALRMDRGQWIFPVDPASAKLLGPSLPVSMRPAANFPLLTKISKVPLLTPRLKGRALEKAVGSVSAQLRGLRTRYTQEAGRMPADFRARSAADLAAKEKAVGEAILRSPLPSGLSAAEREKYGAALQEAAQEFLDQAAGYARIAEESKRGAEESVTSPKLVEFSDASWPWPQDVPALEQWRKDARAKRLDRALVGVVAAKIRGLDAGAALVARAGLVLLANSSEPAQRFLATELKQGGKEELLRQAGPATDKAIEREETDDIEG